MIKDIKIPEISENVISGTVVAILVKVGDSVSPDDPVIEFETEKAVVEIPARVEGKIVEILVHEGDQKNVGDIIARVETVAAAAEAPQQTAPHEEPVGEKPPAEAQAPRQQESAPAKEKDKNQAERLEVEIEEKREPAPAGPASRRLARELGVDIHGVKGSGPGGRITEADVKACVKAERRRPATTGGLGGAVPTLPDFSRWGPVEVEEITTVRRLIAEGTTTSWHLIPHVTQFDEADITNIEAFLQKNAARIEKAGGRLTVTALLMKVCAIALRKFPRFNSSLDLPGRKLVLKHYVHIGLMVDTSRGLLVPVIREADTKSLTDLAVEIVDLAERARNKKIKPDEMEGATFSISNQGGIGGVGFTPVIQWPQAAILGVSRSAIAAKYQADRFVPCPILPLSLSYDHRIIDGADAARFLRFICEGLEQPFQMLL